jgi:hypothetical protein
VWPQARFIVSRAASRLHDSTSREYLDEFGPVPGTCLDVVATIPYQCQRTVNGQEITIALPALTVPRCNHCGELVFDYDAEQQINRACQLQTQQLVTRL